MKHVPTAPEPKICPFHPGLLPVIKRREVPNHQSDYTAILERWVCPICDDD